ncbi:hypothetical protein [Thermaurantiacus sp.]
MIGRLRIPWVERIWRIRGSIPLEDPLGPAEAFARLEPLFQTADTRLTRQADQLEYEKTNPRPQDRLATFTTGVIRIIWQDGRPALHYEAASTALFLCFLAPFFFLAFAQGMEALNRWESAKAEQAETPKAEKEEKAKPPPKLHPIDVMLGAPPPRDPKEDKDKEKFETRPVYVMAGLFVAIYVVGRILEPWLLRRTFRTALAEPPRTAPARDRPRADARHR